MKKRTDHRGFALPAAIGALVIVGILVTAGFYVARQEVRIGVASKYAGMAGSMAQSAANNVMVNRVSSLTSLAIWGTTTVVDTVESGITTVKVTKLGMRMFYLDATATVTEGGALWAGASRRVGIVTRMTTANIDPPSALATQGSLTVGGSSSVSGFDTIPSGWASACDSTSMTDKPGIMIDNPANIKVTGTNFEVAGVPTIQGDTSITASSLLVFGDLTWNDMVAIASKTMSAGPWSGIQPDSSLLGGSYR